MYFISEKELVKVIGGSNQLNTMLTLPMPKKEDLPRPWEKFTGPYRIYK